METEFSKKDLVAFHTKMNDLRGEAFGMDWEPDKMVSGGKQNYKYVSIRKIERNLAPALYKLKMDFKWDFYDLTPIVDEVGKRVWTVKLKATFTDCETGYSETSECYGGCGESDKAVTICQVFAVKAFLSNMFMITDFDEDGQSSGFTPKTPAESAEVRSKVLSGGVAPAKPAEPAKPAAPKAPAKPKAPAPKAEAPAEPKVIEQSKDGSAFVPTLPQRKVIENISSKWAEMAKNGQVSVEDYNTMSMDCASIASTADVSAFIKKYKVE